MNNSLEKYGISELVYDVIVYHLERSNLVKAVKTFRFHTTMELYESVQVINSLKYKLQKMGKI